MPLLPLVPALVMALPADGLDGTPTVPLPSVGDGVDWDAGVGVGGTAGTAERGGEVDVDGYVAAGARGWLPDALFDAAVATGGQVALRAGDEPGLGVDHWARAHWLPLFQERSLPGGDTSMWPLELEHRFELGALPALDGRKDGARTAFGREQLGGTMQGITWSDAERRVEFVEIGVGWAWSWIEGAALHRQIGWHGMFGRVCGERGADLPEHCVEIVPFQALGVEGGSSAAIVSLQPARITGQHVAGPLYADLSGGVGGTGTITVDNGGGDVHTITTDDLPDVSAGTYDVHAYTVGGGFDARAHRTLYLTLDGDLAIEDRAEAALAWGARTRITLRGFAARTTWWTSKTDPGTAAVTGGGELDVARTDRGLAWDASLGVARSFYATLDGAAADAPALGARGAIEVHRALRKRRTITAALSE